MPETTETRIAFREAHLTAYQSARLAKRYRSLVDRFAGHDALRDAVARGYHKLLAYKDEYEVARLLQDTRAKAAEAFDGDVTLTYHLAPPMLSRTGPEGRPEKRAFGRGMERLFPKLAALKWLRGTPFDPFGYTAERRMERALIREYERDMTEVLRDPGRNPDAALALAELPLSIRGFGPVKEAAAEAAASRRAELLIALRASATESDIAAE